MPPPATRVGQRRRIAQLVALAREQERELGDLPHPLRILLGELRAQVRLRQAHAGRRLGLRLAAVPAARREASEP